MSVQKETKTAVLAATGGFKEIFSKTSESILDLLQKRLPNALDKELNEIYSSIRIEPVQTLDASRARRP